jgi:hypothetical protein
MLGQSARLSESVKTPRAEQFGLYHIAVGSILTCGYTRKPGTDILYPKSLPLGNGIQRINRSTLVSLSYTYYPKSADHTRRTLIRMGPSDWNRMETAFHAVGTSVMTCPDLLDYFWYRDVSLTKKLIRFKIWYVNNYCRYSSITDTGKLNKNGQKIYRVDLPNQERTLKTLKVISNWAAWYMAGNANNSKPDLCREVPGFHGDRHCIPWFDGHLGHLYDPWVNVINPTIGLSHCLAQVRSFGRALPPPPLSMALKGGKETLKVLTTPKVTKPIVLEHFRAVAERFAKGLPRIGLTTHISVSRSATSNYTLAEGGRTADISEMIQDFQGICPKDILKYLESPGDALFDAFGAIAFMKSDKNNLRAGPMGVPLPDSYMCVPNIMLYSYPLIDSESRLYLRTHEKFGVDPSLNGRLGHVILLTSSAESLRSGRFDPPPDFVLNNRYPFWKRRRSVRYKAKGHIWLRYNVLCEPGLKIRPLTMQPAWYTTIMQAYRHMLESVMSTDVRLRLSFEEDHKLWELLKYMGNHVKDYDGWEHTSADYKSATDHLAFDLIKSMWLGFFQGNNVSISHPLRVYFHLIWESKLLVFPHFKGMKGNINKPLDWTHQSPSLAVLDTSYIQMCGSNMGEPLSFLTLSLYNICVVELASAHYVLSKTIWDLPIIFISKKATDITGMVSSIVGDDLYMGAPYGVRDIQQLIVADSGMISSKGKDFSSKNMMVLCEDHSYYCKADTFVSKNRDGSLLFSNLDKDKIIYLDVVKIRLLTRMNRIHSDNRASILGKGAMLSVQLDWNPNPLVRDISRSIYMTNFDRTINASLWAYKYPIELPPVAGGMSLPIRDWETTKRMFDPYLRYLSMIISWETTGFISEFVEIVNINRRLERGVYIPVHRENYLDLLKGLKGPMSYNGDPEGIFTRDSIIKFLMKKSEIPKSPYSGQYIDSVVRDRALAELRLVPLRRLLRNVDRILAFNELLSNPTREPAKYSIFKYQKNLVKFWRRVKRRIKDFDLPETHGFRSALDIALKLNYKLNVYVPIERDDLIFDRGPSLMVDWNRKRMYDDKLHITQQCQLSAFPDTRDFKARALLGSRITTLSSQSTGPVRVTDREALAHYEKAFVDGIRSQVPIQPYCEGLPSSIEAQYDRTNIWDSVARRQLQFQNVLSNPSIGWVNDENSSPDTDSD